MIKQLNPGANLRKNRYIPHNEANCQFDIGLILIGIIINIPDYKDSVFLVK